MHFKIISTVESEFLKSLQRQFSQPRVEPDQNFRQQTVKELKGNECGGVKISDDWRTWCVTWWIECFIRHWSPKTSVVWFQSPILHQVLLWFDHVKWSSFCWVIFCTIFREPVFFLQEEFAGVISDKLIIAMKLRRQLWCQNTEASVHEWVDWKSLNIEKVWKRRIEVTTSPEIVCYKWRKICQGSEVIGVI